LTLCAVSFLAAASCHYEPQLYPAKDVLKPGPEVKIIAITQDGNIIVNDAFMLWVEDLKSEIRRLRREVERLKEED